MKCGDDMHLENKKLSKRFFWMLWIMYAVVYMTKSCYSAAMASIVNEGILTKSQTGLINAVFYGVYAPLQIVGGIFADKYNPERMIKIGLVGAGIANLIIFFNQNYYVMLFTWTFNAMIQFALWPSIFKIISSQLEKEYRVKGVYYINFSSTFGLILAYLVATVVSRWQQNFMISAIALFSFAVMFHFASNRVEKQLVLDEEPKEKNIKTENTTSDVPAFKLFFASGFLFLVVVTGIRSIVSNSVQTLSATMLMESYEQISPSIGNLLNVLVIIAGIVGLMLANKLIYPRLIRNEAGAYLFLLGLAIVPVCIMILIGKVPVILIIISLCIASAVLGGSGIPMAWCSAAFAKYGKNGVAAGVNNASVAIAIMLQNYVIVLIADHNGWGTVVYLCIAFLIIACILTAVAMPMWTAFKKTKNIKS